MKNQFNTWVYIKRSHRFKNPKFKVLFLRNCAQKKKTFKGNNNESHCNFKVKRFYFYK